MKSNEMMTTREVADYFGVELGTVQTWRFRKNGPPFTRVSPVCVMYSREDILSWEKTRWVNYGGRPKEDGK